MPGRILTIPDILSAIRLVHGPRCSSLPAVGAAGLRVVHRHPDVQRNLRLGRRQIARLVANQSSRLGELLDPLVDRIYMVAVPLGLAFAGVVPWWLVAVLFGRDAARHQRCRWCAAQGHPHCR